MATGAELWPSQRRNVSSERHSALARMRQRRDQRHDDCSSLTRCPPIQPKGSARGFSEDILPYTPHKSPDASSRRPLMRRTGNDSNSAPPQQSLESEVRRSTPRRTDPTTDESERRRAAQRRAERHAMEEDLDELPPPRPRHGKSSHDDTLPSPRVRGPAIARAAQEEEPLPPGAHGANFGSLQEMISKGIQDAESGAALLEGELKEDEAEYRRRKEEVKQRREQDAEARRQEREKARLQRRRSEEERQRRQMEDLERWERDEKDRKEQQKQQEEKSRREYAAVTKIQARVRGKRLRAGLPVSRGESSTQSAHDQPFSRPTSEGSVEMLA